MLNPVSLKNLNRQGWQKGKKRRRTIEVAVAEEAMRQHILKNMTPITVAAVAATLGERYVYRVKYDEDKEGRKLRERKHEVVSDPHEIGKALDAIANDSGILLDDEGKDTFYYINTKPMNSRALEVLLDRAFGKPKGTGLEKLGEMTLGYLLDQATMRRKQLDDPTYQVVPENALQAKLGGQEMPK